MQSRIALRIRPSAAFAGSNFPPKRNVCPTGSDYRWSVKPRLLRCRVRYVSGGPTTDRRLWVSRPEFVRRQATGRFAATSIELRLERKGSGQN